MVTGEPLYDGSGGSLSLDLVNTVNRKPTRPWKDRLGEYADFLAWSTGAGTLSESRVRALARAARADEPAARRVFERVLELREASYRVFAAVMRGKRPPRADLAIVNAELAVALAHARVEPAGEELVWAWAPDPEALDAPLWPVARDAAEVLTSGEARRLRQCAADTCFWLFLDGSKNHSRRWCDMKSCGNRAKVREHRRRKRAN